MKFLWSTKLKWTLLCVLRKVEQRDTLYLSPLLGCIEWTGIPSMLSLWVLWPWNGEQKCPAFQAIPPRAHSPAYPTFCTNSVTPTHKQLIYNEWHTHIHTVLGNAFAVQADRIPPVLQGFLVTDWPLLSLSPPPRIKEDLTRHGGYCYSRNFRASSRV